MTARVTSDYINKNFYSNLESSSDADPVWDIPEIACRIFAYVDEQTPYAACCKSWSILKKDPFIFSIVAESKTTLAPSDILYWQSKGLSLSQIILKYEHLRDLDLSGLEITDVQLADICKHAPNLESISFNHTCKLKKPCFANLSKLKTLSIFKTGVHSCDLAEVYLENLPLLEILIIFNTSIKKLTWKNCPNIHFLNVNSCPKLAVPDLSTLLKLEKLYATDCLSFESLDLRENKLLEEVFLTRCIYLNNLKLDGLNNLKKLKCGSCNGINQFTAAPLPSLTHLDLSFCINLRTSLDLRMLPALSSLNLRSCINITELLLENAQPISEIFWSHPALITIPGLNSRQALIRYDEPIERTILNL
jgi:hypothetical protein